MLIASLYYAFIIESFLLLVRRIEHLLELIVRAFPVDLSFTVFNLKPLRFSPIEYNYSSLEFESNSHIPCGRSL